MSYYMNVQLGIVLILFCLGVLVILIRNRPGGGPYLKP